MENSDVFDLRNEAKNLTGQTKVNKLLEGLNLAHSIFRSGESDGWTQKALAWVLIDLCKEWVSLNNLPEAAKYYNQLTAIEFYDEDDILSKQILFLRPKIDVNYAEIKKAEDLSKQGRHTDAFSLMTKLIADGKLQPLHHESYGWIIYRYIKSEIKNLDSVSVRTYLRDYMNLKNERPSMLHSMILNFGLNYSKEHSDFNLYKFFLLWNPVNLRYEDKTESKFEEKKIPSLISRICREFIDKEYPVDLRLFLEKVKIGDSNYFGYSDSSESLTIDLIRQPIFWKLYNLNKDNKLEELWSQFNKYTSEYVIDTPSEWHSKILSIAERFMNENNSWRFFEFFKNWNSTLLRKSDWDDIIKDENTYKGLGVKSLKKAYEHVKNSEERDVSWLISTYDTGLKYCSDNEWLKREKALLYAVKEDFDNAISIYKELALELFDKAYFWNEFSSLIESNNDLKIAMLCKAALLEKNDDFLGAVRLSLAQMFIEDRLLEKAGVELQRYKDNRLKNEWKLPAEFEELSKQTTLTKGNNVEFYLENSRIAEEFAFNEVSWTKLALIDSFKDKKNKKRLIFSNGQEIEFSVLDKFISENKYTLGNVFEFKLKETEKEIDKPSGGWLTPKKLTIKEYRPLIYRITDDSLWSSFEDGFAIVDYVNRDKGVIHAITFSNEEIFFRANIKDYKVNDVLSGKVVRRRDGDDWKNDLVNILPYQDRSILDKIEPEIALVDGVNKSKNLFHFVVNSKIDGIVRFSDTELRPEEGEFIEVRLLSKHDKKKDQTRYKVITLQRTDKKNESLLKEITGEIELKYKGGSRTRDFYELNEEEIETLSPNFAFLDDFYIPKFLLEKHNIKKNCSGRVRAINDGSKWKVIEIEMLG